MEVIKEVPVEVIKEITIIREVKVPVVKTVIKKVPVVKKVPVIKTVIKKVPVIKEVIKEIPVEVIKEVEVTRGIDMKALQRMVKGLKTVEVSKKVVGEKRKTGVGKVISRKEVKPTTRKATKVTAKKTKAKSKVKKSAGKSKTAKRDDLTKIEGIGPAIEKLLNGGKIYTFKQLADAKISKLQSILTGGGPKFQMHTPGSWPKQASLAAAGQWSKLKKLQDILTGGR